MGSLNLTAGSMFGALSDGVGAQSGLALSRQHIIDILAQDGRYAEYLDIDDDEWLRIHSVEYQEIVEVLLYSVGRLESLDNTLPMATMFRKYGRTTEGKEKAILIAGLLTEFLSTVDYKKAPDNKLIDPSSFIIKANEALGNEGMEMAIDALRSFNASLLLQSATFPNIRNDIDLLQLEELFASEGLPKETGVFLDQRFIDYLNRNFEQIDKIHWRKFETLSAEYFSRLGMEVALGPGRNDDNVDVRVWEKGTTDATPTLIIQCKRQQASISKVIVKSLYADVSHYGAKSGLIVTTSSMSPGAKTVCEARKYPITAADRSIVRQWIVEMRKPGAGVVT